MESLWLQRTGMNMQVHFDLETCEQNLPAHTPWLSSAGATLGGGPPQDCDSLCCGVPAPGDPCGVKLGRHPCKDWASRRRRPAQSSLDPGHLATSSSSVSCLLLTWLFPKPQHGDKSLFLSARWEQGVNGGQTDWLVVVDLAKPPPL